MSYVSQSIGIYLPSSCSFYPPIEGVERTNTVMVRNLLQG